METEQQQKERELRNVKRRGWQFDVKPDEATPLFSKDIIPILLTDDKNKASVIADHVHKKFECQVDFREKNKFFAVIAHESRFIERRAIELYTEGLLTGWEMALMQPKMEGK